MKPIGTHNYFVYILTNKYKSVLYIGVTNNLNKRLQEHKSYSLIKNTAQFTGKYKVNNLIYFERFQYIEDAIKREKELKKWSRIKKENLINSFNPKWTFLNDSI